MNFENEIEYLKHFAIPRLFQALPSSGHPTFSFDQQEDQWRFKFSYSAQLARFSATAVGRTPSAAFALVEKKIGRQIREWHRVRLSGLPYTATTDEDFILGDIGQRGLPNRLLTALVVDDDVDTAVAVESVFRQLGCQTDMVTNPDTLHQKIASHQTDFIILDWQLSEKLHANQVVARAARLIDTFSDLRHGFSISRPKVITYSVLDPSEIQFPSTGYFEHIDHWQKPISYAELTTRISEIVDGSRL